MKSSLVVSLLFITGFIQAQNTEVHINHNSIGVNQVLPDAYFHIEVPELTIYNDGLVSNINYTGLADRRAIRGHSICSPGYGVGGHFTGGFRGVYAHGDGGVSANNSFPTYGLYATATGTAGTRIGLYSSATGGSTNIAAKFGNGDIEIEDFVRINTTGSSGRLHVVNTDNIGSNATAVRINATNDGSEPSYGTLVTADNTGSGNIIGSYAAAYSTGTGTAYAFRALTTGPDDYAFYGFGNGYISGDLRIGQNVDPYSGNYKVVIDGKVLAEEVRVQNSSDWPDYVFKEGYNLESLEDVESYIQKHHHLPNIPAASVVEKEGIALGDMQIRLMEKVEELTLYLIQQNKEIEILKNQIKELTDEK